MPGKQKMVGRIDRISHTWGWVDGVEMMSIVCVRHRLFAVFGVPVLWYDLGGANFSSTELDARFFGV